MEKPRWSVPDRIETERLVLRRYEPADAQALATLVPRNIEHLERYMEWIKFEPQTVEQREAWIKSVDEAFDKGSDFTLGMFDAASGELLGGTGFHPRTDPDYVDIGYWVSHEHEGRGLVTETAAALTWVALEFLGSPTVGITHAQSNQRSAAIPRRLGYGLADAGTQTCHEAGGQVPAVVWSATAAVLTEDFASRFPRPRLSDRHGNPLEWPVR